MGQSTAFQDNDGNWWRVNADRYYEDESGQWWRVTNSAKQPNMRARCEVRVCKTCGFRFPFCRSGNPGTGQYCQRECANRAFKSNRHRRGSEHPNWRGGSVDKNGYRTLWVDRFDGRRVLLAEHRHVMAQHIGRDLLPEETVHHRNGDKLDNRLENLELWTTRHPKGQRVEDVVEYAVEMLALYAPDRLGA